MVRTVISLEPELKNWLDRKARASQQTMTAVVRAALADYRDREAESQKPSRDDLIAQTQGIWTRGDGLAWQKKMRAEWDR